MNRAQNPTEILVVDDAPETVEVLRRNLSAEGYKVYTAPGVAEAIEILSATSPSLVITDYKMPRASGMELVRHIQDHCPELKVVMVTGFATIPGAVEAIKGGVLEYLPKPFTDAELLAVVERSLDRRSGSPGCNKEPDAGDMASLGLLGSSAPMQRVYRDIRKAAASRATVLVTGESGTGKELVARAIHYGGPTAPAPFVPVNCGAIPETLIESALFGHVKGAFTGASEARAGFFRTADGGTIFLDEIAETSQSMQVKLLRVMQEREICMVGSTRPEHVDVRIVAATNKDLLSQVAREKFREDLYYRINVITIALPPLRRRGDDILLLAHHFVRRFAEREGRPEPVWSEAAEQAMTRYAWPGNVRELENVVHRLVVMMDDDVIKVPDLPAQIRFSQASSVGLTRSLVEVEAEYIRNVLVSTGNNKTKAARILGIDRKTLRDKLKTGKPPVGDKG
jgi:two-component system, NtrC family, response regulator HydG